MSYLLLLLTLVFWVNLIFPRLALGSHVVFWLSHTNISTGDSWGLLIHVSSSFLKGDLFSLFDFLLETWAKIACQMYISHPVCPSLCNDVSVFHKSAWNYLHTMKSTEALTFDCNDNDTHSSAKGKMLHNYLLWSKTFTLTSLHRIWLRRIAWATWEIIWAHIWAH